MSKFSKTDRIGTFFAINGMFQTFIWIIILVSDFFYDFELNLSFSDWYGGFRILYVLVSIVVAIFAAAAIQIAVSGNE